MTAVLNKAPSLVAAMILTRAFAPAEMGQYFLVTAICFLVLLLTTFGTHQHLSRAVASDADGGLALLGQVLVLRLPLTLGALVVLNAATALAAPALLPIMLPISLFVLAGDIGNSYAAYLNGRRAFAWRFLVGLAGPLVLISGVPVAVAMGATLPQTLLCFLAAGAATVLAGYLTVRGRYGPAPVAHVRWRDLRRLAALCWPFVGLEVLQVIQFKIDVVMVYGLVSSSAAALYETAYRLLEVSRVIARPLAVSALPICAYLLAQGRTGDARRRARQALFTAAALGTIPAAIGLIAPDRVMAFVWGAAYAEAGDILRILLAGAPLVFIVLVGGMIAVVLGRERRLMLIMLAAVVFNVSANAVAIPVWGAVAAAWTTLATELFISAGLVLTIRRSVLGDLFRTPA